MNPYAEAEVSGLAVESRIHWLIIAQAVGIFLLVAVPLNLLPLGIDSWQDTWPNAILTVAIGLSPWALGAAYLAMRVSKRWAIDGLVFSIATSLAPISTEIYYELTNSELEAEMFLDVPLVFLIFAAVTMIIMSITKAVLRLIRVLISKVRSNRNVSSVV